MVQHPFNKNLWHNPLLREAVTIVNSNPNIKWGVWTPSCFSINNNHACDLKIVFPIKGNHGTLRICCFPIKGHYAYSSYLFRC
jgi:hypothetical protein